MVEIEVKSLKKVEVVKLSGKIDSSNASDFDNTLKDLLSNGRRNLVLDMSNLEYMSSAGLRAIVAALKSARSRGGDVVVAEPSERMVDTLKLVGFQSLFKQYDNVLDAVDAF
jgi:anti-sigma B factor antagonist